MIGRFNFKDFKMVTDDGGNIEFTAAVSPESKYAVRQMVKAMRQETKGFTITIDIKKNHRSLDQNALMWALLEIMAQSMNGGRTGGIESWDCYLAMIEKYGSGAVPMQIEKSAFEALKKMYRAVKHYEELDFVNDKGNTIYTVKAFVGSSQYDTQQMKNLIDGIFDELATMQIDVGTSREISAFYDDWRNYKESKKLC